MIKLNFFMLLVYALTANACRPMPPAEVQQTARHAPDWKGELAAQLPLYGHRNWVLVVDKAFPFQTAAGITYLDSKDSLPTVLSHVLETITDSPHVKPVVYQDAELAFIDDQLAPGANDFKQQVDALLKGRPVYSLPHEAVFEKMDEAAKLFGILVIKTETLIPYSSIFIELDCAYWDTEREQQLRAKEKE